MWLEMLLERLHNKSPSRAPTKPQIEEVKKKCQFKGDNSRKQSYSITNRKEKYIRREKVEKRDPYRSSTVY